MQLSDDNLFIGSLPQDWTPLLEHLCELDRLVSERDKKPIAEARKQAALLRQQILRSAKSLSEETPQSLQASSPEFRQWFTEACLLWPLFADSGGTVLVDTIGSPTLAHYPIDFQATDADRDLLRRALRRMFGWSSEELDGIESNLRRLTENLTVKKAIAQALWALLEAGGPERMQQNAVDLMRRVYGALPWKTGDVDVVLTTSAVFFCLRFDSDFSEPLARFIKRVRSGQQSLKGIRFPAFGVFDAELVDPALLAHLTEAARADPAVVAATFSTMVTILPTPEVDKFLVHDVWGHGWQESLCEFESVYRDLSKLHDPPAAPVGAFEAREGRTLLRAPELLHAIEPDLRRRISVGVNLIVSEFLADLVEFNYLKHRGPLPSSSMFIDSPLCLDLSLEDTRSMMRAWRRPFVDCHHWTAELIQAGLPETGLAEAIAEAASLIEEHFRSAFEDSTTVKTSSNQVHANLLQRIVLSVFALDAALEEFLSEGEERYASHCSGGTKLPRWRCPLACTDLLVLLLGWSYEQHRAVHVWGLDELVTRELLPALLRLEEAIKLEGQLRL